MERQKMKSSEHNNKGENKVKGMTYWKIYYYKSTVIKRV